METIQSLALATQAHESFASTDGEDQATGQCAQADRPAHGWTAFNQAMFLTIIAEGETVEHAATCCGLSAASAYALRQRPAGQAFALGWEAARILARERLADLAFTRAIEGWDEVTTRVRRRDDDEETVTTTRRRIDNGLLSRQLARLDTERETGGPDDVARLIAREFDAFIDLIRAAASPARIALFLSAHGLGSLPPALEPLVALARADTMLRGGVGLAAEVDTADLDPAARAGWTAEQWRRAEAAGLIALAPASAVDENAFEGQISQPDDDDRIWHDDATQKWVTDLPPPAGFDGYETGEYGDYGYRRDLSDAEQAAIDVEDAKELADQRSRDCAVRDRYFGFAGGTAAAADDDDRQSDGENDDADEGTPSVTSG